MITLICFFFQQKGLLSSSAPRESGRQHQEACLAVLPTQDGALLIWAVPPLDEEPGHPAVLVVRVPNSDPGPPAQGRKVQPGSTRLPLL